MEEKKQFKQFGSYDISKDSKSVELDKTPFKERNKGSTKIQETIYKIDTSKTINVNIGRGVIVHLNKTIDCVNIKAESDYLHLCELDRREPEAIIGFTPSLYYEFIDKNKSILNHCNIGDSVQLKSKFRIDNVVRVLTDIYFKSLNNMTVIVAVLDNKDLELYNRLEKCK